MINMPVAEYIDRLDGLILNLERANSKVEAANTARQEALQKIKDFTGIADSDAAKIKDMAHQKIGIAMLEERRKG